MPPDPLDSVPLLIIMQVKVHFWSKRTPLSKFLATGLRVKWYVDGEDYMSAVADSIEAAQVEIFITDWQMSPHLIMKRLDPTVTDSHWRLDEMLRRKARQGVKIYILLYWDYILKVGPDLGSELVKNTFKYDDNITVYRHPNWCLTTEPRWSHHEKIVVIDDSIAFIGGIDLAFGRWDNQRHKIIDNCPIHHDDIDEYDSTGYFWSDQDYINIHRGNSKPKFYSSKRRQALKVIQNSGIWKRRSSSQIVSSIDRRKHPRMPWHDVGCSFNGLPVKDLYVHLIQRYLKIAKSGDQGFQEMMDKMKHVHDTALCGAKHVIPEPSSDDATIQVLRSVSEWSAYIKKNHLNPDMEENMCKCENSIYEGYLHLIKQSEHFIYIENQFFISSRDSDDKMIKNKIASTLADRIIRAHIDNSVFHVIVVMPLKPDCAGSWEDNSELRILNFYNNAGIRFIYKKLETAGILKSDIPKYFKVYGLRQCDILDGCFVTEVIYVHSKLMIVDDRVTIIGSANINDRSMSGKRDSEVAVMVKNTTLIGGRMNGEPYGVGKFSHNLRCCLMMEHLGLLDAQSILLEIVRDPLAPELLEHTAKSAKKNTDIYERVFGGEITPTNAVLDDKQLKAYQSKTGIANDIAVAAKELGYLQGRLVDYQLNFLVNSSWKPSEHSEMDKYRMRVFM